MIQKVLELLSGLPAEIAALIIGALPVAEVRGGIPVGMAMGLSGREAYLWACLGNLLPILPVLLFLDPVSAWLRRFPLWKGFFDWLFARAAKKGGVVEKYEALGLAIFVGIPLPMTGAWTGCVVASLFKIPFRAAFPAIAAGVLAAGLIVLAAVKIGIGIFYLSL
ncbi:MAG: small multi-drug export protein [Candidatus Omnitrophica bacterium]|nr:small multi-drug export protein [Candidatus Omnitrophota bacterium]